MKRSGTSVCARLSRDSFCGSSWAPARWRSFCSIGFICKKPNLGFIKPLHNSVLRRPKLSTAEHPSAPERHLLRLLRRGCSGGNHRKQERRGMLGVVQYGVGGLDKLLACPLVPPPISLPVQHR